MNTPAQILIELKSLQEELAQQEKACGLAARFCPGDLGNGLNEFSTFCLFTGGRLEAAIAQLEAMFDAGNKRDDQRIEQVICTFDADDLGTGLDQHRIENEIRAELIRRDITGADIAREAGCTKQYVSAIIKGKRKNSSIQGIISSYINKPISDLWPDQEQA